MKRKAITVVAAALIATMAFPGMAFAADTTAAATTGAAVSEASGVLDFTTPAVTLSLADAYKRMESSVAMQNIALQKKSDEAVSKGYTENIKSANRYRDNPLFDYDTQSVDMVKANRDWANKMIVPNDEARKNALNKEIYGKYYKLKNTEQLVAIAKDNLSIKEDLLKSTQLKYNLGSVSKMDLLNAQMDLKTAQDSYTEAADGLKALKMEFNIYMGYDLMQDITLTDDLVEAPLPEKNLSASIKDALNNRCEILEIAYALDMCQLDLDSKKAYSKVSTTYINSQIKLQKAQLASSTINDQTEMDVKVKYMTMMQKYQEVQSGKQSVANAAETARLALLQYNAGIYTLNDVQTVQMAYLKAQNDQAAALLNYYLAIDDYKYSSTAGLLANTLAQ